VKLEPSMSIPVVWYLNGKRVMEKKVQEYVKEKPPGAYTVTRTMTKFDGFDIERIEVDGEV
jgi:hypothetical protein